MFHRIAAILVEVLLALLLALPAFAQVDTPERVRALVQEDRLDEALTMCRELLRAADDADAYGAADAVAETLIRAGRQQEAADLARRVIDRMDRAGARNAPQRSRLLQRIAVASRRMAQFDSAAVYYERAAGDAAASGDAGRAGQLNARAARIWTRIAAYERADSLLDRAFEQVQRAGDTEPVVEVWRARGFRAKRAGRLDAALRDYDRALALADTTAGADMRTEWQYTAIAKANVLYSLGRYRESLAQLQALLPGAPPAMRASILNGIGNSLIDLGDPRQALAAYEEALRSGGKALSKARRAIYVSNMASCSFQMGRTDDALDAYLEAGRIFEESGQPAEIALNHLNVSTVYWSVRNVRRARQAAEQALAAFESNGPRRRIPSCLLALAKFDLWESEPDRARLRLERAVAMADSLHDVQVLCSALVRLGDVELESHAAERAAMHYQRALDAARSAGHRIATIEALSRQGTLALDAGRSQVAFERFDEATRLADDMHSHRYRIGPLRGAARALLQLDRPDEALLAYRSALDSIERVRFATGSEDERRRYFGRFAGLYAEVACALATAQHGAPADILERVFELAEAGKARSFIDRMDAQAFALTRSGNTGLLGERRELLAQYSRLQAGSGDMPDGQRAELLEALNARYDRLDGLIRQAMLESGSIDGFAPVAIDSLQAILEPGALLLEFVVHADRALLALVTRDQARVLVLADGTLDQVRELVELVRKARDGVSFDLPGFVELASSVYERTVARALAGQNVDRLIVVTAGPFAQLPFECLLTSRPAGAQLVDPAAALSRLPYLFRSVHIAYAPSATALLLRKQQARVDRSPPVAALVVASPDYSLQGRAERTRAMPLVGGAALPHARREGQRVARLLGPQCRLLAGREASEARWKNESLARYGTIHIAAHALVDEESPLLSSIVLASGEDEDGFLTMREIYDCNLAADLVVLSACETAQGPQIDGDGVVALARAFLAAGADATLVALWRVDDFATAEWMVPFYEALVDGQSKREALRLARLAMIQSARPALRLPYYWAPFIQIGIGQ